MATGEVENLAEFGAEIVRLLDEDDISELIELLYDDSRARTVQLCSMEIFEVRCYVLLSH